MYIALTLGLLAVALVLFVTEWVRYDLVALLILLTLYLTGTLDLEETFAGFSNPAVITVATVLVMSRAVQGSGLIQLLGARIIERAQTPQRQILFIMIGVGLISGFINDVGAAALLLPMVVMVARKTNVAPSKLLIPLAVGCLLGGTLTMIGTPPNILITEIMRDRSLAPGLSAEQAKDLVPFTMFDFTPIGVILLICGVLYMVFIGRHLLPERRGEADLMARFEINDYLVETRILEGSPLAGKTLDRARFGDDVEFNILGFIRGERTVLTPRPSQQLRVGDLLLLVVPPEHLSSLMDRARLEIVPHADFEEADFSSSAENIELVEAVVMPESASVGQSLKELHLRRRFGLAVIAISRHGEALLRRVANHRLRAGDTLLIQGDRQGIDANLPEIGCLPLAQRPIRLQSGGSLARILIIFLAAIVLASTGLVHVAVAFTLGTFLMIVTRCIRLDESYKAIEWPILILMGGMIPLGTAMDTTGTATWVASGMVELLDSTNPHVMLGLLFVLVSGLTMVLNNPTVAVIMAPIAIDLAGKLEASPRPFLMLTAIAASCAFLAPVSHKANILVWGPGGYRFLDYTKVGLPLILILGAITVLVVPLLFPF